MSGQKYPNTLARIIANTQEMADLPFNEAHGPCWCWMLAVNRKGYGYLSIRLPGKRNPQGFSVHRLAWELIKGPLSGSDVSLDHLCGRKRCWNPSHLEPLTVQYHQLRELARRGITYRAASYDAVVQGLANWARVNGVQGTLV